jgi:hypothetical protein
MHPTMNTFLAAALASSSVALHAHAMQQDPPARPLPPPPPSNSLVSAPAPGSTAVTLPPQTETWVLNSPVPTVSPSWGYRATVMGERVFVGGPERAVSPGACGQLCMWERVNGEWKADPNLFQVERVGTAAFVLQRLERGGNFIFTAVDRRGLGTSVRVLEPQGGRVVESASLILPAEADLPSFASSFASDGNAVAIGSADLRFNLKEESLKRNRDPKVFLYSREGSVWKLDGFVKTPAQPNGAPADAMWFGASLDIDGDVLAVGSPATLPPRPSEVLPLSGFASVQVFRRSGGQWMPEVTIQGMRFTQDKCFGLDLAVGGDLLAVRSFDPETPDALPHVWLFARTGGQWQFRQELLPATGLAKGRAYGFSLGISKGRIVVGDSTARAADETGESVTGTVFVFEEKDGKFVNTRRLMPKAPCGPRSFGNDVSIDWPLVAVGRPKNERLGLEPGGAYVFDLSK